MLITIGKLARRWAARGEVWTNVYGLGRSLLAIATALTLALNESAVLFRPLAGAIADPPYCAEALPRAGIFCLLSPHLDVARWIAVGLLAVVASGWRPRFTGVVHWWIASALQTSASTVDGGDQCAAVLTLLLIPITLTDDRVWHWHARAPSTRRGGEEVKRLIGANCAALMRLQIAGIYYHAAVGKVRVTEWADGTAVYYWLTHPLFGLNSLLAPFIRPFLINPFTVSMMTWGVIVVELFLMMGLVATRAVRKILLAFGITLHLSIMVMQGLGSFSLTMFGALILYLWPLDEPFSLTKLSASVSAWVPWGRAIFSPGAIGRRVTGSTV
jgi:antimicrobial peptide system SdpB family protein